MNKRKRELAERLEELFSPPAEPQSTEPTPVTTDDLGRPGQTLAAQTESEILRTILNQLPLPVYIKDREHKWIAANPAFCALIGLNEEQLLGHADTEQADDDWKLDDQVLESGQFSEAKATVVARDGTTLNRRVLRTPLTNSAGGVEYLVGIVDDMRSAIEQGSLPIEEGQRDIQTELEKANAALRTEIAAREKVEERFRLIGHAIPIPLLISRSSDDKILFANELLGRMFGLPNEDLVGQTTPNFYYNPADRQELLRILKREGHLHNYEVRVTKADGTAFWVAVSMQPLTFEGEPALFTSFYDITERKDTEREVLQRNLQLAALNRVSRQLVELAEPDDLIEVIFTAIGQVMDNSNLYVALYNAATNMISFPIYTIDGEHRPVSSRPFANGMTEYIIRTKQPVLIQRDVESTARQMGIDSIGRQAQSWMGVPLLVGAKVIGVLATQDYNRENAYTEDQLDLLSTIAAQAAIALENARLYAATQQELAERRQAEEELLKFKLGLERSSDAIFITDTTGRIVYVNPAFEKIYGFSQAEAIGHTPRILKSGVLSPEAYKQFWATLLAKEVVAGELINKTKDGRMITIEGSNNPIVDEAGNVIGFLGTHRDITDRKRAEAELERRAVQLQTASEVSRAAASILNLDELLPMIVELVRERFGLNYAGVFLLDLTRQFAVLRAGTGTAGSMLMERGYKLAIDDSSMIGWCISHRQARVALDVGEDAVHLENPLLPETRSELALPLIARGQVVGAITIQSPHGAAFGETDIAALQTMADQVATAIENARFFEESQIRAEELGVLNELAQTLTTQLDVKQVLEQTYRGVTRLIDATNFYIGLYDPQKDEVTFLFNLTESEVDRDITVVPGDKGLTGYVIRNRTSVLIQNNLGEWLAAHDMEAVGELARSWLGVPMIVGEQILGVMAVQSFTTPYLYDEHDQTLLAAFANQAAIAIQNARFFEQIQRDAERERTINRIAAKIRNTQSVEQILKIAAQELRLATQTSRSIAQIGVSGDDRESRHTENGR